MERRETTELVCSLGDPNGIGPEVLLKALDQFDAELGAERVTIVGPEPYLQKLSDCLGLPFPPKNVRIRDCGEYPFPPPWGAVTAAAGDLAATSLIEAVRLARSSQAAALVTPPVCKEAMHLAGHRYPGQTEFVGSFFPESRPKMAFFSDPLRVILVTTHLPLRSVPDVLSVGAVVEATRDLRNALFRLREEEPVIGVCGLNPHASENGLFGSEEATVLIPAVEEARNCGWQVEGPLPADTAFLRAYQGRFDGLVALYHDQALIPVKLLAFDRAVNVTLGLPILRTSPDHGTAFDIAGQGTADPSSMLEALRWAVRLGPSR
ncbi:MAG: 4-hydroxythreonine-4-phosphate dehydrogenase PdxA [Acidobacteriota bacterium]